jgi:hypothetical protein
VPDALDRLALYPKLGPLEGLSMAELRAERNGLQRSELTLSFVRRLVQVRLDIVLDERQYRAGGAATRDVAALVAELPKILAEHGPGAGRGSFPEVSVPPEAVEAIVAELDGVFDVATLGSLGELSDERLASAAETLGAMERRVSNLRRALHASLDALQEEMLRRYKSGEASVDSLLQ